jgi:trigger factor
LEKKLSEEAEVEYAKSERGLRFQLKEGEMVQSDIKITFEDLKAFTTKISVNKWHNSDKQIYRQESSRIVARVL